MREERERERREKKGKLLRNIEREKAGKKTTTTKTEKKKKKKLYERKIKTRKNYTLTSLKAQTTHLPHNLLLPRTRTMQIIPQTCEDTATQCIT